MKKKLSIKAIILIALSLFILSIDTQTSEEELDEFIYDQLYCSDY